VFTPYPLRVAESQLTGDAPVARSTAARGKCSRSISATNE
jgi:hypothetical protein